MAGIEPFTPVQPQPEDFGLTTERIQSFRSRPGLRLDDHPLLGGLIGWAVLVGASFLASSTSKPLLYFWPIAFGCGIALLLLATALDVIATGANLIVKKTRPDYQQFVRFQEAEALYQTEVCKVQEKLRRESEEQRRIEREALLRRRDEARRKESWWRSLSGHQFERELYELFKLRGYDVHLTGLRGNDRGIDMVITANQKTIIVQCKAYSNYLSAAPVRELYGTLLHENEHGHASEAWLICTSGFYRGAKSFASGKPIRLMTMRQVLELYEAHFL